MESTFPLSPFVALSFSCHKTFSAFEKVKKTKQKIFQTASFASLSSRFKTSIRPITRPAILIRDFAASALLHTVGTTHMANLQPVTRSVEKSAVVL